MSNLIFLRGPIMVKYADKGMQNSLDLSSWHSKSTLLSQQQVTGIGVQYAGWSTLMENVLDPSHINFAHAGVIGDR